MFQDFAKHNYIFIGGTGSGKTELSLNCAVYLAKHNSKKVCFFDMDQTKGLFRARDFRDKLLNAGVCFSDTVDFWDFPIVPSGITGAIDDENAVCVFDVGGNKMGARMIGQYARYFTPSTTDVFFVINPYRPFSDEATELTLTMAEVIRATRMMSRSIKLISNPCMGKETTAATILSGHARLNENLKESGEVAFALTVEEKLLTQIEPHVQCPVYPIHLYVAYQ